MGNKNKKIKDSELYQNYMNFIKKDNPYYDENAYYFGMHYTFDGLDVQNLKNPIFDNKKMK